ncbi:deoxyribonuclease IV [Singulisphaera acidiphila]|uniref:Probable endonuclease 4 n=1 Tax=Singulisphaera acidiphila (strain ATCC BAA-1392 / DSM 18658 / VKM B-2454 / MOB10) TaxID=886293 RepID=L0DKY0_SINAD|nr:deoxyribonuclease IV [Singulisphaera acidiphila]AGA29485.1 apurinic endonuclease APN1 [Singulisphaera acidiphila DSM 18658]
MKPARLGAHMSIAGGCDRAVTAAHSFGFDTVQLFTKNNNQWKAPTLTDAHVAAFRSALKTTGVGTPVAHNSYLINLGSPDDTLWNKSIDAMVVELERCEALGILDLVAHPGAHVGSGEEEGLKRIAAGIDEIHRRVPGLAVRIDLETTAGQGTCLGHRFEHLGTILGLVKDPGRLGVCVDTCHIFAAGYSLATADEYDGTMHDFDRTVGVDRVRVWHLNDSRRERGSRVDRHAGIGQGHLGLEPFRFVVTDPRFRDIPMILETPKGTDEQGEEFDAVNLRLLRQLETRSSQTA